MLHLRMWQNDKMIDLLKSNADTPDQESLLQQMVEVAKVERTTAEAYLSSWRYNHHQGAMGAILGDYEKRNQAVVSEAKVAKLFIVGETKPLSPAPDLEGGGKIAQILKMHMDGKTNAEIIAAGFNKSTVSRQVSEHKKRQQLTSK